MTSISPFIPAGSYQQSSTSIKVTLSACCANEQGGNSQSSLSFTSVQLTDICDISNNNGTLSLQLGSSAPVNTNNQFVPAGSYQNSASNIQVIIEAQCRNEAGDDSFSATTYSQAEASGFADISNQNGQLLPVFGVSVGSSADAAATPSASSTSSAPTSAPTSTPTGDGSTTPSPTSAPTPTTSPTSTVTQTPSSSSSSSTSTSTSTTTPQNTCSVSNNLILPTSPNTPAQTGWDGGIVVISGYNTSSTSTAQDYLQNDLTLLSFIDEGATVSTETSSTSSVLPANQVGTLNLLPYYQPGTQTPNVSYNLLVSQANNYFPVAVVGEIKMGRSFAPISLPQASPCNSSSAANAYVFLQNMMAYPSSPLAQQFTAALNQDNSANPATGSSAAVNAFFAGTTNFANVNFEIYSSVSSYASAYAYIWADFQQSYTYHFYTVTPESSDSSSAVGSTSVKQSEQFSSLGTVVFTQLGGTPAAISDANAGYSITWNPKGGIPVGLNFVDGQLVANDSDGFSGFCLQTTFMNMAQLTGNSADMGIPIQALVGVINGSNVIGSAVVLSETEGEKWSKGLNDVLTSKAFRIIQIGMSLYFMIDIGVKLCDWIKDKCSSGESPSADEVAKAQSDIKDEAQEKADNAGNDEELKTGDAVGEEQASAESTVLNAEAEESEASEIDEQFTEEEVQAALEDNSTINDEVDETNEEEAELEDVDPESSDASADLESIQDQISSNQSTIVSENESLGDASSAQVQQEETTETEEDDDEAEDEKEEDEDEDGDFDDADDLADLDV